MTSSWKAFGRKLEVITVVLLVLAVAYLWVNSESEETEAPHVARQAPDVETGLAGLPHQPPLSTLTDVGASQQTTESTLSGDNSLTADLDLQDWRSSSTSPTELEPARFRSRSRFEFRCRRIKWRLTHAGFV